MKTSEEYTLYARDSKDRVKEWKIQAVPNKNGTASIHISSGLHGGKLSTKTKVITVGKNIGKANETTPFEQAVSELQSKMQKKIDEGYLPSVKEAQDFESGLPMLAQDYFKSGHRLKWKPHLPLKQYKLNGIRCLARKVKDSVSLISRTGKDYTKVLSKHTALMNGLKEFMYNGQTLDGELYVHGWTLQRIAAATKKFRPDTEQLQFWIFDAPNDRSHNAERYDILRGQFERKCGTIAFDINLPHPAEFPLVLVTADRITSESTLEKLHNDAVLAGFEGLILRNADALYQYGKRTADLLKYKKFKDDEFEITGYYDEVQTINEVKYQCIVFICKTKEGVEFHCRPRGSLSQRQEWWKDRKNFMGKQLTVRYFELTDDSQGKGKKVPQFPVGIAVRDYE